MEAHLNPVALLRLARLAAADQTGQTLAEYGPLVAVIALVVLLAAVFLGSSITGLFDSVGTAVGGL
jgi:pilus assembly protein Flp/PilA